MTTSNISNDTCAECGLTKVLIGAQTIRLALLFVCVFVSCFAGNGDVSANTFVLSAHSQWQFQTSDQRADENWTSPDYDDSDWKRGRSGFGYGDRDDRTRLEDIRWNYDSVQIRRLFHVEDPAAISRLYLYLRYDDALMAYVNGTEIARAGIGVAGSRGRVPEH